MRAPALSEHTTLRLGGPPPLWLPHTDPTAWPDLVHAAARHPHRPFTLGAGSNTLADDHGPDRPVIHIDTRGIRARLLGDGDVVLDVAAGHPLDDLVTYTVHENLTGIEYLGGIPGTTGAAPVQNAGAYGQETGATLTAVTAYDWTTRTTTRIHRSACGFGYRTSVFKQQPGRWTILSVALRLRRSRIAAPVTYQHLAAALDVPIGARPPLAEAAAAVVRDRRARGLLLPDDGPDRRQAGSCYLNPRITPVQAEQLRCAGAPVHRTPDGEYRTSAGWLLEHVGFTPGSRIASGIRCSSRRALTLTVHSGATAAAFRQALGTMAAEVHARTGITLAREPVFVPRTGGPADSVRDSW